MQHRRGISWRYNFGPTWSSEPFLKARTWHLKQDPWRKEIPISKQKQHVFRGPFWFLWWGGSMLYGRFLKWWVSPNNHGVFLLKMIIFGGVKWGYHHLRKHPCKFLCPTCCSSETPVWIWRKWYCHVLSGHSSSKKIATSEQIIGTEPPVGHPKGALVRGSPKIHS